MINLTDWTPSSDGKSTFGKFLQWINNVIATIRDYINGHEVTFGTYVGQESPADYIGTATSQVIDLGFKPVAVEIYAKDGKQSYYSVYYSYCYGGLAMTDNPCIMSNKICFEIVSNGFKVYSWQVGNGSYNTDYGCFLNDSGIEYYFKAYKGADLYKG